MHCLERVGLGGKRALPCDTACWWRGHRPLTPGPALQWRPVCCACTTGAAAAAPNSGSRRAQDFSILGCLRDHKDELAAACREEVFKRQQNAADDWRTDKELAAACKARRASRGPSLPPRPRSCGALASRRTLSRACCTRQDWAVPSEGLHRLCHPAACEVMLTGAMVCGSRLLDAARHKPAHAGYPEGLQRSRRAG